MTVSIDKFNNHSRTSKRDTSIYIHSQPNFNNNFVKSDLSKNKIHSLRVIDSFNSISSQSVKKKAQMKSFRDLVQNNSNYSDFSKNSTDSKGSFK